LGQEGLKDDVLAIES